MCRISHTLQILLVFVTYNFAGLRRGLGFHSRVPGALGTSSAEFMGGHVLFATTAMLPLRSPTSCAASSTGFRYVCGVFSNTSCSEAQRVHEKKRRSTTRHEACAASLSSLVIIIIIILIIIIIIIIIIDRSTVADQLLQLVEHVLCAFGVERSRQTF